MLVENHIVASGRKILIPVSTTISTAADVKYVSQSVPTVHTMFTHSTNTSNSISSMVKFIVKFPNTYFSLFHRR